MNRLRFLLGGIPLFWTACAPTHSPASSAKAVSTASAPKAPVSAVPQGTHTSAAALPASPPRVQPNTNELDIVLSAPAWDAVFTQGQMIALDSDFQSVTIFDTLTGKMRFRTGLPASPGGRHTFRFHGDKLILWAGNKMYRIDPRTGALISTESARWNNDCSFEQEGDSCAYACSCGIQMAECETGKLLGAEFEKTFVDMHESGVDGEPSSASAGCFGRGVGMLASGKGVALLAIEDNKKPFRGLFSRPLIYVGVDSKTGKERWRNTQIVPPTHARASGASEDGRSCFVAHEHGDIYVLDCQTGTLRWKRPGKPSEDEDYIERALILSVPKDRLFQRLDEKALMLDIHTGKVRWQVELPKNTFALPAGIPIPPYTIGNSDKNNTKYLWLLNDQNGAVLARVELPPNSDVVPDPAGGFYLLDGRGALLAYESNGTLRARLEQANPGNIAPGSDFIGLFSSERFVILDRRDLHILAELAGEFSLQKQSSLEHGILLFRFNDKGKKVGEAVFVRRPSTKN